jgi:hypothetical protein
MFSFLPQTMWIERSTYTTAYTFPGILKWFEVKQISTVSHLIVTQGKKKTNNFLSVCKYNNILCYIPPAVYTSLASLIWPTLFFKREVKGMLSDRAIL